jgi:hypothetical protein
MPCVLHDSPTRFGCEDGTAGDGVMFTKVHRLPKEGEKTALLIRFGAWGDMVWASAVITKLHEDGYHITLNCVDRSYTVVMQARPAH